MKFNSRFHRRRRLGEYKTNRTIQG